jgi:hypothetical protein
MGFEGVRVDSGATAGVSAWLGRLGACGVVGVEGRLCGFRGHRGRFGVAREARNAQGGGRRRGAGREGECVRGPDRPCACGLGVVKTGALVAADSARGRTEPPCQPLPSVEAPP